MDNELQELEAELKGLRPVAPSAFARARVGRELANARRPMLGWLALPLAAAIVGLIYLQNRVGVTPAGAALSPALARAAATPPTAKAFAYKPVSAENVLYDVQDEGMVTLADGTAARRYRSSYVDTITWKNPRTQASLRWSVPRTVERVIPVSFQ
ncbi:MAG: hypothetical protein JSR48_04750 [Verrucomicrobia bacterium]|nr:hypothetical protein [Verrucomicrobiota bacterium]